MPLGEILCGHGIETDRKVRFVEAVLVGRHGLADIIALKCYCGSRNGRIVVIPDCTLDAEAVLWMSSERVSFNPRD